MKGRARGRGAILTSLALGAALAGLVALGGTAQRADAALADKIVFTSNRAAGFDNPTHDYEPALSPDGKKIAYQNRSVKASDGQGGNEIFIMNTVDGSGKKNLTDNRADDGLRIGYGVE